MTEIAPALKKVSGSFRDPSGFLFTKNGILYRQLNASCREDYEALMASGLYEDLRGRDLLVSHEEVSVEPAQYEGCYKIIRPETIPFISYPYEWCFGQLKDAALAMLDIQRQALGFNMSLKDASAYNIQFRRNRPVLIDTLSFEKYREGAPWVAYGQFCRHFLAPLALMSLKDGRLNRLSQIHIDGIPLDLASALLPALTRYKFGLLTHLHLHARFQARYADSPAAAKGRAVTKTALMGIVESLRTTVLSLRRKTPDGAWSGYYGDNTYGAEALAEKERIVSKFLRTSGPKTVWDLGANTGRFSRIAAAAGAETISMEADLACVEENYLGCLKDGIQNVLPLVVDLTNPSPGIGWENGERPSLIERGPADTALALALIHHLAIANNLPFERIAEFFRRICGALVIEFVPKGDPQVRRLLAAREDIFPGYTQNAFEETFSKYFTIRDSATIQDTGRTLYLMVKG